MNILYENDCRNISGQPDSDQPTVIVLTSFITNSNFPTEKITFHACRNLPTNKQKDKIYTRS